MNITLLLSLLLLLTLTSCSHNMVISPSSPLSSKFSAPSITLHSSAFGYTPKGVSINGILTLSSPLDACTAIPPPETSTNIHTFFLANSSNCPISVKAKNIFTANGYAAIIIKDTNTTIQKHGSKVNMPVLQISPSDAAIILQYFQDNPSSPPILTTITFSNPSHKPIKGEIDLTLWLSSTNIQSYNFLESFKSFYTSESKSKNVYFKPRYVLDSKFNNKTAYHIGCLSSGRYCAPELELQSRIEGKQVVEEDLRQIIIYETNPDLWWNYVLNWRFDCLGNSNIFREIGTAEYCSNFSMVKAGIDPEVIRSLYLQSFRGPKVEIEDNEYLLSNLAEYQATRLTTWPKLIINHKPYNTGRQTLEQSIEDIKLNVCFQESANKSVECGELFEKYYPEEGDDELWVVTMVLIALGLLMAVLVLVYKWVMRRKMKEQIQEEVDRVLEQYYTYEGASRLENM